MNRVDDLEEVRYNDDGSSDSSAVQGRFAETEKSGDLQHREVVIS